MERHGNVRNLYSRHSPPGLLPFGPTYNKDQNEFMQYLFLQFKFWKKERDRMAYKIRRSLKFKSMPTSTSFFCWTNFTSSYEVSTPSSLSITPEITVYKNKISPTSSFTSSHSSITFVSFHCSFTKSQTYTSKTKTPLLSSSYFTSSLSQLSCVLPVFRRTNKTSITKKRRKRLHKSTLPKSNPNPNPNPIPLPHHKRVIINSPVLLSNGLVIDSHSQNQDLLRFLSGFMQNANYPDTESIHPIKLLEFAAFKILQKYLLYNIKLPIPGL